MVIETARIPGISMAERKPPASACTILVAVKGSPRISGARTTAPRTILEISGAVSWVMKLESTDVLGHSCQRTEAVVSWAPGVRSPAATSTSLMTIRGPGAATVGGVPPPRRLRASRATPPAAMAATASTMIRDLSMG